MSGKLRRYSYNEQKTFKRKFFLAVLALLAAFALYSLISSFIICSVRVKSASMEPEIESGDCLLVASFFDEKKLDKPQDAASGGKRRGIAVLLKPFAERETSASVSLINRFAGFITFQQIYPFSQTHTISDKASVRRLLAFPGEQIYMKDYILHIKPVGASHFLTEFELTDIDYDISVKNTPDGWDGNMPFSDSFGVITLGKDEYFVLADNRLAADSRLWGPVGADNIRGAVLARYWPFARFKIF